MPTLLRCFVSLSWLTMVTMATAGPAWGQIAAQNVPDEAQAAPPKPAPVLTKAPELITFVNAPYPPQLLYQGIGGEVVMLIDLDAQGQVERIEVTQSAHPDLTEPAMTAVSQFEFSPAEVDNVPSGIRLEYRYKFTPQVPEPDVISGEPDNLRTSDAPVSLTGTVREAGTRNAIAGAVIYVFGRPVAESGSDGSYEVRGIPPGEFKIKITGPFHDAYETTEELERNEQLEANYYLLKRSYDPYSTTVRTKVKQKEVARVKLDQEELRKVPGTSGDPIRVIENLPGMARTPGGLGGALLVRGANPTDTKVFIDGVEIPLLYHFFGLTSVVNANMLDEIDFFPGGFGARYGDAVAGIVNVKSRDLDCNKWRGEGEISFLQAAAYTCLPLGENWKVAAAARRSYIDLYLPAIIDAIPRDSDEGGITIAPAYYDYQLKAAATYGTHRLDIFAFGSNDDLKIVQSESAENLNFSFDIERSFHRLNLRDRWQITPDVNLVSSISPGYIGQKIRGQAAEADVDNGFFLDVFTFNWQERFEIAFTDELTLRGGFEGNFGRFRVRLNFPVPTSLRSFPSPVFDFSDSKESIQTNSFFNHSYWSELGWETDFGLVVNAGFRFDRWDFGKFQRVSAQPRASARWEFKDGMTAKAAYGWYEKQPDPQFLGQNPTGNPNILPLRSHQFIVGYEHEFTDLLNLDVQAFYNLREQIPSESKSEAFRNGVSRPEIWASNGGGQTYGLEILLRYLATKPQAIKGGASIAEMLRGRFYGWLAYTFSRSVRFDRKPGSTYSLEQGDGRTFNLPYSARSTQSYLSDFDQTHILTLVGQFVLPWGIEAGFRVRLVSGNPFTPQSSGVSIYDADADSYVTDLTDVRRNSGRMPYFFALDYRVDKTFTFDLWKLTVFLEVLNTTNRMNVEQVQNDYRFREQSQLSILPLLPLLGVKGEF